MRMLLAAALLTLCASTASAGLKTGTYRLDGVNPGGGGKYHGTVTIEPSGKNYRLTWLIGGHQAQTGVAMVEGQVLSVGYLDASGRDFGVVSYKIVGDGRLEGRWAGMGSKDYGLETLTWRSASVSH